MFIRPILQKHFNKNRTYGIVIWSQHDDEISVFNEKVIEDSINQNKYTPPTFVINLEKSNYIRTQDYSTIIEDLNKN
jgi:hypothetical protein